MTSVGPALSSTPQTGSRHGVGIGVGNEPKRRADNLCLQCGGPLVDPSVRKVGKNGGSFMHLDTAVWKAMLEIEPFCSVACANAYHGVTYTTEGGSVAVEREPGNCVDCGKPSSPYGAQRKIGRCGPCAKRFRRRQKAHAPGCCTACGGDRDNYTQGCIQCNDRRYRRQRRLTDPDFARREKEASARAEQRRREARRRERENKLASDRNQRRATLEPTGLPSVEAPVGGNCTETTIKEAA